MGVVLWRITIVDTGAFILFPLCTLRLKKPDENWKTILNVSLNVSLNATLNETHKTT